MRYYAVIDTNVLVSALLRSTSVPGVMMQESLTGRVIPLLNEKIVEEYREVLSCPKFRFDREAVKIVIDGLIKRGMYGDVKF